MPVDDLDSRIDALYGGPPAEFTSARDALVRELRAAGRVDDAQAARALRRPSKLAARINRLVREDPSRAEALLGAQSELAAAQARILSGRGDAASLRTAETAEAAALDAFDGDAELRAALRAASRSDARRDELRRGRLSHDPVPEAGAGGLFALGPAPPARAAAAAPPEDEVANARRARAARAHPQGEVEDEAARDARQERARAAIAALEGARRGEDEASEARDAARRDLDDAEAAAGRLAAERDAARARLDEAAAQAEAARVSATRAQAALAAAEAALKAATRRRDGAERAARRVAGEAPG